MFELQKPKAKAVAPSLPPAKVEQKPLAKPVEIQAPKTAPAQAVAPRKDKELDWGDDDSMSFDSAAKLMSESTPAAPTASPPRISTSVIQFDTQELEFVTDEQLLKSARTFHTSPAKETATNATIPDEQKEEHLRVFWCDAYEDAVAQPGTERNRCFQFQQQHVVSLSLLGKIFLFGKTPLLTEDKVPSKTFVSVCLIIDNIPKQVFFSPKPGVSERLDSRLENVLLSVEHRVGRGRRIIHHCKTFQNHQLHLISQHSQ